MKYKIVQKIENNIVLDKITYRYYNEVKTLYGAYRKGTIFGFCHNVGTTLWSSGGTFTSQDWFDSKEKAISYAKAFNTKEYGSNEKFEIIK